MIHPRCHSCEVAKTQEFKPRTVVFRAHIPAVVSGGRGGKRDSQMSGAADSGLVGNKSEQRLSWSDVVGYRGRGWGGVQAVPRAVCLWEARLSQPQVPV